jgi:L-alanine-DL-glutamate epimerase-like enolase superfamily enzyme
MKVKSICAVRPASGGVVALAMGAIENALLDATANASRSVVVTEQCVAIGL